MTLHEWLDKGEADLRAGPHPDRARLDAETLLLHLVGKNKAWLLAHLENDFAGCAAIGYASLLDRRRKGEPIQYITGEAEFYGLPFRVTPDVLIPRPETEHLIEKVLNLAANFRNPRIVDIGTGSGAIAIVLARALSQRAVKEHGQTKGTSFSPYISSTDSAGASAPEGFLLGNLTATDISAPALAIANENATRNKVDAQIHFLQGDLLSPLAGKQFEIIVSNPPYVPIADRDSLAVEVRDHEPAMALFAGEDGLDIYRRLIPSAFASLVHGGFIALEIGFGQQATIHTLLADAGFSDIEFTPDLQGIQRVASAHRP